MTAPTMTPAELRAQARETAMLYAKALMEVQREYTSKARLRNIARSTLEHLIGLHLAMGEEPEQSALVTPADAPLIVQP